MFLWFSFLPSFPSWLTPNKLSKIQSPWDWQTRKLEMLCTRLRSLPSTEHTKRIKGNMWCLVYQLGLMLIFVSVSKTQVLVIGNFYFWCFSFVLWCLNLNLNRFSGDWKGCSPHQHSKQRLIVAMSTWEVKKNCDPKSNWLVNQNTCYVLKS